MNDTTFPWLTILVVLPLVGAAAVWLLPASARRWARQVAVGVSLVTLVVGVLALGVFDVADGHLSGPAAGGCRQQPHRGGTDERQHHQDGEPGEGRVVHAFPSDPDSQDDSGQHDDTQGHGQGVGADVPVLQAPHQLTGSGDSARHTGHRPVDDLPVTVDQRAGQVLARPHQGDLGDVVLVQVAAGGPGQDRPTRRDLYQDDVAEVALMRPGQYLTRSLVYGDRQVVDGTVSGVARAVAGTGELVRRLQNGYVRSYALTMALGVVVLAAVVLAVRI